MDCLLGKLSCLRILIAVKMVNSDLIFRKFLFFFFLEMQILYFFCQEEIVLIFNIRCCQLLSVSQIDPIS